jgi:Ca2+:H+ antiporter
MSHYPSLRPNWPLTAPIIAAALWATSAFIGTPFWLIVLCGLALGASVVAAVDHAETVAHRLGEPYGTIVLALAVTVIEAALIVSMMLGGGASTATLARDSIFAAVMVICTGVIGASLWVGAYYHREQAFRVEGVGTGLSALMLLATLILVLPSLTTTTESGTYSDAQMIFVAIASLVIWLAFVFIQTMRHKDYFLHTAEISADGSHPPPPSKTQAWVALGMLFLALVVVIGLAKLLSPSIETALVAMQAPPAVLGIVIAILVLLPETIAAIRAARANRLQTSMNLAIGSALASIGLTIPVVICLALWLDLPLTLGLAPKAVVLLLLTFGISLHTVAYGRSNIMQGIVHLVIFVAFLFFNWVP